MRLRLLYLAALSSLLLSCSDDQPIVDESGLLLRAQRWQDPGIYDAQGRYMLMRGVNLNTLGDYWEANASIPATAPYEADHFRLMASYGFNVVRLIFNWSALEPQPGQYDQVYIDRLIQAIEDAATYGVYVILDMHQDAWSKHVFTPTSEICEPSLRPAKGWDGAPLWATLTEDAATCSDGRRESVPAVQVAFKNFWNNVDGIQDHCIDAWEELVRQTAHYPTVLGYDAFNEPSLGSGGYFSQGERYNKFLSKLVDGIREAESSVRGFEHVFFFETTVTWSGEEVPFTPSFSFTQDENIVFAPHNYFEVIIHDLLTLEQGAELYQNLANTYGTHCFIGEWGVFGNPESLKPKLKRFANVEDQYFMGSTWWQWCQAPGDPHGISWDGDQYSQVSLHLLEVAADGSYTGEVNEVFLDVLSRARPVAIHGQPLTLEGGPDLGYMSFRGNAGSQGVTKLWVPDRGTEASIMGTNVELIAFEPVEGGYFISVNCAGIYTVELTY